MSTTSNNNDPLEDFFREKAQDYDITYREEDWQKLESQLDDADQRYKQRWRRRLVATAAIFLFAFLGYMTYTQQLKINELHQQLSNQQTVSPPSPSETLTSESEHNDGQSADQSPGKNQANNGRDDDTQNQPPQLSETSELASQDIAEEGNISGQRNRADITEKSLAAAKVSPGLDGPPPAISVIKPINFSSNVPTAASEQQEQQNNTLLGRELIAQRQKPTFSVGLVGGPDLSTVGGISSFHKLGYSLGISLEYHISKNLAISAGAHRTKVQYMASGNDYRPPEGYWSYGVVPDQTEGICLLIDIPVSLKYTFKHFQDSRLFASAGLSSYIMLNEDYRFDYDSNQPQLQQRWQERTGTSHWMSNATLSVGYELDISPAVSLRAEPFIKLPLQEVGWGNVNLYSMGSFFSINYNIR
ncbi:MAG: hypothetical protein U5J63_00785 [Fodinibius sp.]|nr:hypothetical protein [Fodinibius sp.]